MRSTPCQLSSVIVTCVGMAAAGCAQVEQTVGETYDAVERSVDEAFADRGDRYCLQAGGLGALAGGAAGAGIGYAITRDYKGAVIGGAIGAIGAAIAGCKYGVWIANRREAYDSESERLNAELQNASATNESLAQLNEQLRGGLAEREQQLAQLKSMQGQAEQKTLAKEELAKELAANRKGVEQQLQQAANELAIHKATLSELQKAEASTTGKKVLKDIDSKKSASAKQDKVVTDIPSDSQSPDHAAKIAEYKVKVAEMEKAIADLRGLNQRYAKMDSRIAAL